MEELGVGESKGDSLMVPVVHSCTYLQLYIHFLNLWDVLLYQHSRNGKVALEDERKSLVEGPLIDEKMIVDAKQAKTKVRSTQ